MKKQMTWRELFAARKTFPRLCLDDPVEVELARGEKAGNRRRKTAVSIVDFRAAEDESGVMYLEGREEEL